MSGKNVPTKFTFDQIIKRGTIVTGKGTIITAKVIMKSISLHFHFSLAKLYPARGQEMITPIVERPDIIIEFLN
ncbi:hypothetical protein GCM10007096_35500 [Pullulanibacillus pueri]|uniref:Uncharacterized protein n=1 Tax=Pullulanibacillus pueri TaxID=1437324 RepID=A0A8J2ZZG6_9BACL|nr:hypothetical protein GCM10007096_35500 [Pullulanibacillus pueri]